MMMRKRFWNEPEKIITSFMEGQMERAIKEQSRNEAAEPSHSFQGHSVRTPALTAIAASIDNSPRMVAQRRKLQSLFGGIAQLQEREEETVQGMFAPVQRAEADEEEPLQGKFAAVQRVEEEEPLQARAAPVQREGDSEEEEPLQGKFEPLQRQADTEEELPVQGKFSSAPVQRESEAPKPNNTGLPDNLKSGIESLSGMSMDAVRVHYNSSQPAQLNALAYAQGTDIHVGPGQEKHLPHEAWHVVQQAQGRVKPTMQMKEGVPVNDDPGLEHEADVMGGRAVTEVTQTKTENQPDGIASTMLQKSDRNLLIQKFAPGFGTQRVAGYESPVQLYSYAPGTTKTITLINAGATDQTNIDVCTYNSVTYDQHDLKQTGSGTGTASWAGWLTDAGTNNNATQLHVVNQNLGGDGGATDGNIGPGSQNLNSHHLHQAENTVKNKLFDSNGATADFTYACTFDYSNSVDKVHNTPTAQGTAIGDPVITATLTFGPKKPAAKSVDVSALEKGVIVTPGYNMTFGKA
jgi:hypothetical protein